ncbi:hypothetical protein MBLNU459_g4768t2 [Dothideomycetes sp. NU459]
MGEAESLSVRVERSFLHMRLHPQLQQSQSRKAAKIWRSIGIGIGVKRVPIGGSGEVGPKHQAPATMGLISGLCLVIIAIFLPPLAVLLRTGCGGSFLINIVLTILGWIPGILHAWYVIVRYPSHRRVRRERRAKDYRREKDYQTYERHERHSHRSHSRPPSASSGHRHAYPASAPTRGRYYYPQETGYTRRY